MADESSFELSDDGNARRFASQHRSILRWVVEWGAWIAWDGVRWALTTGGRVTELARKTVRLISDEAETTVSRREADAVARHALRSQSKGRIDALISLAAHDPSLAISAARLDREPFLLNVANGTLDLRSKRLRPHSPEDYITKLAPVRYDESADYPYWQQFIEDCTGGSMPFARFLQRVFGYCLTGSTKEEKFFVLIGPGGTGKSTIIEAFRSLLGDYATATDFTTFLTRGAGGIRSDIARLEGARFVSGVEADRGERLSASLVKQLTGGDRVTARRLYRDFTEFTPQFKLMLATNHLPKVEHDDSGMWRRIVVLPFDHAVPPARRKPTLKQYLTNPALAGPTILRWAVEGCQMWLSDGLGTAPESEHAEERFRKDMDPIGRFVAHECELGPYQINRATLLAAFRRWLNSDRNSRQYTPQEFYRELSDRGFQFRKKNGVNWAMGLRLANPA